MPLFKRFVQATTIGAGASIATFFAFTRNSRFDASYGPSPADSVFSLPSLARLNPEKNPTFHDYCVRRVPLSKIKPGLLADEDKLTTEFCRGLWSGQGMMKGTSKLWHPCIVTTHEHSLTLLAPKSIQNTAPLPRAKVSRSKNLSSTLGRLVPRYIRVSSRNSNFRPF